MLYVREHGVLSRALVNGTPVANAVVGISTNGLQVVLQHVFADFPPDGIANFVTRTEVHATPNPRHRHFIFQLLDARVLARHTGHRRICQGELRQVAGAKHGLQYRTGGAVADAMSTWILRMHRRVDQWRPAGVAFGSIIAVAIAVANGGNRPPETIMILGVENREERVGECDVEMREQLRALS